MKTIHEWLKELPQDIYDKAKLYEPVKLVSWYKKVESLRSAIGLAFDWQVTDEGFHYWDFVAYGNYEKARALLRPENEPIRGFIELTKPNGVKHLVHLRFVEDVEPARNDTTFVTISGNYIEFTESYETVKQLIREATK